jgi:hypothetical protein
LLTAFTLTLLYTHTLNDIHHDTESQTDLGKTPN